MNGRRSDIEIIGEILRLGRAGKTEIMYKAELSYFQLEKYLDFLTERGLLERVNHHKRKTYYQPTSKGRELLGHIDSTLAMLGEA